MTGLETGNAMAPYVNYVHVIPGREKKSTTGPDQHDLLAWESRYVMQSQFDMHGALPRLYTKRKKWSQT